MNHDTPTEKRLFELRSRLLHTDADLAEIKFLEDQLRWTNKEERRIADERAGKQVVREMPLAVKIAKAMPTAPVALLAAPEMATTLRDVPVVPAAPEEEEPPYYQASS